VLAADIVRSARTPGARRTARDVHPHGNQTTLPGKEAVGQIALRFVLGGLVVTAFAVLGDMLKPKRFAGIFGAAPAVALATLTLTFAQKGADDVATMGRSLMAGAVGFLVYSLVVSLMEDHVGWPGWLIAGLAWLVWFAVAFGIWGVLLR